MLILDGDPQRQARQPGREPRLQAGRCPGQGPARPDRRRRRSRAHRPRGDHAGPRGFGCRVLANNSERPAAATAEFVSLDALLRESDVVTLHLPLNADTHHFIGRDQLRAMKPGGFLINTPPAGALVETDASLVALESGRLGGAALDVLEGEEGIFYFDRRTSQVDHPFLRRLQQLPNAIRHPAHGVLHDTRVARHRRDDAREVSELRTEPGHIEQAHDRDLVRGLLGGTRRVGEVRDGERGQHRPAEVRTDLRRHHQIGCLEDVRAAVRGMGRR